MKKFLAYIFIGIILTGSFGFPVNVSAQTTGQCWRLDQTPNQPMSTAVNETDCNSLNGGRTGTNRIVEWRASTTVAPISPQAQTQLPNQTPPNPDEDALQKNALAGCGVIMNGTLGGCLVAVFYYIFNGLAAMLLTVSARFFDLMLALTLSSAVYGDFIGKAWTVVRDISNIFFILVLLYTAIQTILGIGHDTKKIIANVIIMALLINFSMFFSKVVIDASNILALIFYNKMDVTVLDKNGVAQDINYIPVWNPAKAVEDKDVAGALVDRFNPTKLLTQEFFDKYTKTEWDASPGVNNLLSAYVGAKAAGLGLAGLGAAGLVAATPPGWVALGVGAAGAGLGYFGSSASQSVPITLMLGIITISGAMMLFAAYAFFVAGWSFLGRLIELWVLVIASPFAFMSLAVPQLAKLPYAGWNDWIKRLLSASFMAPIFMFFVYLIILIIKADPIGSLAVRASPQQSWMEYLLLLLIPALLILGLLLQATKYAKKGAGEIGEMTIGFGKALTGLAVGGAFAGTALLGRNLAGRAAASLSQQDKGAHRGKASLSFDQKYDTWLKGGKKGAAPDWATHLAEYERKNRAELPGGKVSSGLRASIGAFINKSQLKVRETAHAEHEMGEVMKKAGVEGVEGWRRSAVQNKEMFNAYKKANLDTIRKQIKEGVDSKNNTIILNDGPRGTKETILSESQFKERETRDLVARIGPSAVVNGQVTEEVKQRVNSNFNEYLKTRGERLAQQRYHELEHEAGDKVTLRERVAAGSTGGTYDARALADLVVKSQSTSIAKLATAVTAATVLGLRTGLKKVDINTGTPKGDFMKDLGNTLTEAMKSANVKVDISHVTEEHGEDSHGGGHGGGGHH